MTTPLEILDTAVKIGLGALISGASTYLLNRRSHHHELQKIRLQEASQLIRDCLIKLEKASTLINHTKHVIFNRMVATNPEDPLDIQDCIREFMTAFNEIAGSRYFCESFFGHPCPTSGKNYATATAFGGPSRPASLVAYPTRGMQHSYAMTRRDFGKPAFSLRKKRFVKTHALSLLGTTRLLSRSEGSAFDMRTAWT